MFLSLRKVRNFFLITKMRHRSTFFIHFVIVFITCAFIIDKLFLEKPIVRKNVVVQNDLLLYNDDGLRPRWPFQISRYYDVSTLRTYKSKPRILAQFDLPGERGEFESLSVEMNMYGNLKFPIDCFQAHPLYFRQCYKTWPISLSTNIR